MEEKINETVEVLCSAIGKQAEVGAYEGVAELTNALAYLIVARANCRSRSTYYGTATSSVHNSREKGHVKTH